MLQTFRASRKLLLKWAKNILVNTHQEKLRTRKKLTLNLEKNTDFRLVKIVEKVN